MKNRLLNSSKYLIIALLLYFPIFGHLNTLPLALWDESRLAINAYEMTKNHDYIVTHYYNNPDMWNTKPPLMIWTQVAFMKIIGVNELSVRLPSAFAAFFLCLTLLFFSIRYLKSFWFGAITILVLITSQGYVNVHSTRSGDYDSLLTLFTTLSCLVFYAFSETQKQKYLYLFFVFTALAVLTKGISGFLFLPALFIYAIIQKQVITILKNKHFYIGLASMIVIIGGYYILREIKNEGYIASVMENELGGRYLKPLEGHEHGFWYYYNNFIDFNFTEWFLFVPCGIITGFLSTNKKIKSITLFSSLLIFTYLLIISVSKTKIWWYDIPTYPFLSILVGGFIYLIFELLANFNWNNLKLRYNILPFIFLFLIFYVPYPKIISQTFTPQYKNVYEQEFFEISDYLKEAIKGGYNLDGQYILYDDVYTHIQFYLNVLNDKGVDIKIKDWKKSDIGDVVIAHRPHIKNFIEEHYQFETISTFGKVKSYKILGLKN